MVSRMKITNIANNRDKQGYFYSSEHYHPTTHHLAVEPWLCGYCLKLDSEIEIPSHSYFAEKDYMDALKANRIIDFEIPSEPQKEVVVEQKAAQEKVTEKTFIFSEKLTEIAQSVVDNATSSIVSEIDKRELAKNLQKFADATASFAKLVIEATPNIELGKAFSYVPNEEELKEAVLLSSESKKLIEAQKEKIEEVKEEIQEKEPAKKPIKPYSFQKGKK